MLSLPSLKKQWIWFSACFHSTLNKQWKVFPMFSLLCTKQYMGFSTCCHCSLSNISGCSFSCTFKAHLVGTGWIPYVVTAVSLSSWYGFLHVVTVLSQKAVDGFPSCHCNELSSVWSFYMLSLLYFKHQWMQFLLCFQSPFIKHWMDFHMLSLLFH